MLISGRTSRGAYFLNIYRSKTADENEKGKNTFTFPRQQILLNQRFPNFFFYGAFFWTQFSHGALL
jgi:hypothetical protein